METLQQSWLDTRRQVHRGKVPSSGGWGGYYVNCTSYLLKPDTQEAITQQSLCEKRSQVRVTPEVLEGKKMVDQPVPQSPWKRPWVPNNNSKKAMKMHLLFLFPGHLGESTLLPLRGDCEPRNTQAVLLQNISYNANLSALLSAVVSGHHPKRLQYPRKSHTHTASLMLLPDSSARCLDEPNSEDPKA